MKNLGISVPSCSFPRTSWYVHLCNVCIIVYAYMYVCVQALRWMIHGLTRLCITYTNTHTYYRFALLHVHTCNIVYVEIFAICKFCGQAIDPDFCI